MEARDNKTEHNKIDSSNLIGITAQGYRVTLSGSDYTDLNIINITADQKEVCLKTIKYCKSVSMTACGNICIYTTATPLHSGSLYESTSAMDFRTLNKVVAHAGEYPILTLNNEIIAITQESIIKFNLEKPSYSPQKIYSFKNSSNVVNIFVDDFIHIGNNRFALAHQSLRGLHVKILELKNDKLTELENFSLSYPNTINSKLKINLNLFDKEYLAILITDLEGNPVVDIVDLKTFKSKMNFPINKFINALKVLPNTKTLIGYSVNSGLYGRDLRQNSIYLIDIEENTVKEKSLSYDDKISQIFVIKNNSIILRFVNFKTKLIDLDSMGANDVKTIKDSKEVTRDIIHSNTLVTLQSIFNEISDLPYYQYSNLNEIFETNKVPEFKKAYETTAISSEMLSFKSFLKKYESYLITKTNLFEIVLKVWFSVKLKTRGVNAVSQTQDDVEQGYYQFAEDLAADMELKNLTKISSVNKDVWDKYFSNPADERLLACPIIYKNGGYEFINHKLGQFLTSKKIFRDSTHNEIDIEKIKQTLFPTNKDAKENQNDSIMGSSIVKSAAVSTLFQGFQIKEESYDELLNKISEPRIPAACWVYNETHKTVWLQHEDTDSVSALAQYLKKNGCNVRFGRNKDTKLALLYVVIPDRDTLKGISPITAIKTKVLR